MHPLNPGLAVLLSAFQCDIIEDLSWHGLRRHLTFHGYSPCRHLYFSPFSILFYVD